MEGKGVFQRVYAVFIFPCKSGGVFFSSFYVSDLSYTVPSIVFLDFRAVFNLYIKVVLRCFFTCDRLSCLRRRLKTISRWPLENCLMLKIHPVNRDTKQIISSLISNSHSFVDFLRNTGGERWRSGFFQHPVKFGTLSILAVLFANFFAKYLFTWRH